jgi:hypothetical protein
MKIVIYQKGKWEYDKFVSLTTLQENYPLIKRGYKEKRLLLQYRLLYLFKLLLVGEIPEKAILTLDLKGFRDDKESRLTVAIEAINHNKNLSEIQKMVYNTSTNRLTIYCEDLK